MSDMNNDHRISIISLTKAGGVLAQRLLSLAPHAEHLHRPTPFAERVQNRFESKHRLIFITATGIAVRTLAPFLKNKHTDPAVLVMDEQGRFIIPLLSGHEGGANVWAHAWAEKLGATCVVTTAQSYTKPIYVAGVGCERGCAMEVIRELAENTLAPYSLHLCQLDAIASIDLKADESGLLKLAETLQLPAVFFTAARLNEYRNQLTQRSDIVFRETGCYGVAEAAALAQAETLSGRNAELIIPKQKNAHATFAVARAYLE